MRTAYIESMKAKAQREMKIQNGATKPGRGPPVEYLRALHEADEPEQVEDVKRAHKEGRGPPSWAGKGGRNGA